MRLTEHGRQRLHERVGLKTSSMERMASRALEHGVTHAETKGLLRLYLSKVFLSHRNANNLRVYGEHVYVFAGQTLVTVLPLPVDLRVAARKARARRGAP